MHAIAHKAVNAALGDARKVRSNNREEVQHVENRNNMKVAVEFDTAATCYDQIIDDRRTLGDGCAYTLVSCAPLAIYGTQRSELDFAHGCRRADRDDYREVHCLTSALVG